VKKSGSRGGPCGRPGATIRQPADCPYDAPLQRDYFTASQALGNQAQAPVKPRKGRQNRGEFPRRNLFFRPAGAAGNKGAFWTQGWTLGYPAGSALRAFSLAYQYVQKRATNQEKCPGLHFYVAHRKKVWRLIQTPVCGKKEVTSKSAKAFDYVVMLRFTDGRSS